MRDGHIRLVTIVVVAALCGFAIVRGWSALAYSFAAARAESSVSRSDVLSPWTSTPGVASLAREALLQRQISPRDKDAAAAELERQASLLSIRPLLSQVWLSTAAMRLFSGVTTDKVEGAILMSSLTGPNEGYVMMSRGIFGLTLWDSLRPEVRRNALTDVGVPAAVGTMFTQQEWNNFRTSLAAVLGTKTPAARREIVTALIEGNRLSDEDLTRLGLTRE
jgi:hypothetical protein